MDIDYYVSDSNFLNQAIYNASNSIYEGEDFAVVNLDLSEHDLSMLQEFKIDSYKYYANYAYSSSSHTEVNSFLQSLSYLNSIMHVNYVSDLIQNIIEQVLYANNGDKYGTIVAIEVAVPTRISISDWHVDREISIQCSPSIKEETINFLAVLKGQPTSYYILTPEIEENLREKCFNLYPLDECHGRRKIAKMLNLNNFSNYVLSNNIYSTELGNATMHLMSSDKGVVHSQPFLIEQERILLTVLTAPHNKINTFQKRMCNNIEDDTLKFSCLSKNSVIYTERH